LVVDSSPWDERRARGDEGSSRKDVRGARVARIAATAPPIQMREAATPNRWKRDAAVRQPSSVDRGRRHAPLDSAAAT